MGLGARYCLQKYKAWKEARNTEKQKALNGALNDLDTYWSNSPNEKSLPVYEKKNKIDEKIEKKGDLSSIIAEKQPIGQYISLNQEHASPDLDEERDLMTERPKQFLKTEKNADAKAAIDALFDKATQFEKQTDEEIVGKISQIGKIARQHNLPINGVLDEISKRYELHLLAQYPNTDDTRFIKHQVNAFTGLAKAYLLENKASEVTDALTEEVDLMTEKPKPFLNLEKQVKEGRKIILLPPTQEKTLRQILEEEIQSEELKQDGKSIKQRLNEKMGSFFDKPADTNAEAVPEQMPKPLVQEAYKEPEQPAVQETYKQPEQPIPVQEEPKQILPESVPQTPLQESYQKPESPVQEEDEDDDKDERMLEQ